MFANFKCYECKEFMVSKTNLAYTYGQCSHYFCSECCSKYGETAPCPAKLCSSKDPQLRVGENLSKRFNDAFGKFVTPMCEDHDQQIEFICFDPNCTQASNFCCEDCGQDHHQKCKSTWLTIRGFCSKSKISLHRYSPLIKNVTAKLKERQLVCPKLDEISDFIDKRILRLCNLEDQFFCANGFKSDYELVNDGNDILVHDKVLKEVEPLVSQLLENWENKSLETISSGLEKIGTVCKIKKVSVNSQKYHAVIFPKKRIPTEGMDDCKGHRSSAANVD